MAWKWWSIHSTTIGSSSSIKLPLELDLPKSYHASSSPSSTMQSFYNLELRSTWPKTSPHYSSFRISTTCLQQLHPKVQLLSRLFLPLGLITWISSRLRQPLLMMPKETRTSALRKMTSTIKWWRAERRRKLSVIRSLGTNGYVDAANGIRSLTITNCLST